MGYYIKVNESSEQPRNLFEKPRIESERGEFERVATNFNIDCERLILQAYDGNLIDLDEELWSELENTDSNRSGSKDWEQVKEWSEGQEVSRDWRRIKNSLDKQQSLPAPIIVKYGNVSHLVSGNTRLMVARAAWLRPKVWFFMFNCVA